MAVDELLILHTGGVAAAHPGGAAERCPTLPALRLDYDRALFRWEMAEFEREGFAGVGRRNSHRIAAELDHLAATLGDLPRVLSHRDYHARNLFVQSTARGLRLRVLDFQDALMAPAAQDLAVLLTTRDVAALVTPELEAELLRHYLSGAARMIPSAVGGEHEFLAGYRLCVLQHALKVIGRFSLFERTGKAGYGQFIPLALTQARRMLAEHEDFPALRAALELA